MKSRDQTLPPPQKKAVISAAKALISVVVFMTGAEVTVAEIGNDWELEKRFLDFYSFLYFFEL